MMEILKWQAEEVRKLYTGMELTGHLSLLSVI